MIPKLPEYYRFLEFTANDTGNHYANAVKLCAKRNGRKWKYTSRSWSSPYASAHWKLALQIQIEQIKRRKEFKNIDMADFEFDRSPFDTLLEQHTH